MPGTQLTDTRRGKNGRHGLVGQFRQFRDNTIRLQLHALAYNLGGFMRTLALPKEVKHWSLATLQA